MKRVILMSEEQYDPESLAQEYLDALDQEIDDERRSELEDTREELKKRRKQYVQQHGEDSRIVQRVDQKIEDVEVKLEELKESAQKVDELRVQLLEATVDGFEFDSDWLSPTTLKGLTHALYEEKDTHLILDQTRIESPQDLADVDDLDLLDMEHTLLVLIEDRLGNTDTVSERWKRFTDSKYHTPFLVVAREGTAAPENVLTELGADANRKDAKNWLERPLYDWDDLVPYYRAGAGEFGLSTSGEYLAYHYAEPLHEVTEADADEEDDNAGDGQVSG